MITYQFAFQDLDEECCILKNIAVYINHVNKLYEPTLFHLSV